MDSYDNDLMLLLLMDDDLFFVCIEEDSQNSRLTYKGRVGEIRLFLF